MILVSDWLTRDMIMADDINTEWDNDCPGLVETLAREVEVAHWEVDPPDG
jgi:hypothetical protein